MFFPIVQRISPFLSLGGKTIGGTACYIGRLLIFIKLKQFRGNPHIRTVKSNVNWHITYYLYTLFVGIFFQSVPLLPKTKLKEFIKARFFFKLFFIFLKRIGQAHFCIVFPIRPGHTAEFILERHEKRIISQPRIFSAKADKIFIGSIIAIRFFQ